MKNYLSRQNYINLTEATKKELIDKSKHADVVKKYGTTRYDRKNMQHVYNTVASFNKIDCNALFRANLLSFIIPIHGETNDYEVEVLFEGICDEIQRELKSNKMQLEYKCIYRAIIDAINKRDIMVGCTCSDWKYRFAYVAQKGGYNGGRIEMRPANITNPGDTKGAGCKHVMNVLDNLDWALKLATSIFNYINYMRENYEDKYARLIHPVIYGMSYDKSVQLGMFDNDDELANTMDNIEDEETLDKANDEGEFEPELDNREEPEIEEEPSTEEEQ